jgi:predicted DNA-binding transcriptional regulator AlpA
MQARTLEKKRQFLTNYDGCDLHIESTCRKIGIGRRTYYDWLKNDLSFRNEVKRGFTRSELYKAILAQEWAQNKVFGITTVCKIAGVSRWTFYNWRNNDFHFNQLVEKENKMINKILGDRVFIKEHPFYKKMFKPHIS